MLEGEITLELDDGCRLLRQGDVVVQMGTRHAWSNSGNTPARLLFVMVGAQRGQAVA
ncbi:Cupin domain protein [compost metagenome]